MVLWLDQGRTSGNNNIHIHIFHLCYHLNLKIIINMKLISILQIWRITKCMKSTKYEERRTYNATRQRKKTNWSPQPKRGLMCQMTRRGGWEGCMRTHNAQILTKKPGNICRNYRSWRWVLDQHLEIDLLFAVETYLSCSSHSKVGPVIKCGISPNSISKFTMMAVMDGWYEDKAGVEY